MSTRAKKPSTAAPTPAPAPDPAPAPAPGGGGGGGPGGGGGGGGGGAGGAAVPAFSLNPQKGLQGCLDFTVKRDTNVCEKAIRSPRADTNDGFDLSPSKIQGFLTKIKRRCETCDVNTVNVPATANDLATLANRVNFTERHGELSVPLLQAHVQMLWALPQGWPRMIM